MYCARTTSFTPLSRAAATFGRPSISNGNVGFTGPLTATLTGPDAANFAIVFNSCGGFNAAPGATCGVTVQFQPQAGLGGFGPQTAALTITSDADPSSILEKANLAEDMTFEVALVRL